MPTFGFISLVSPAMTAWIAWTSHTDGCAADEQSAGAGVQLTPAWARELAGRQGVLEVLNPEALRTRSHPLLSEDHMVKHVHIGSHTSLPFVRMWQHAAQVLPSSSWQHPALQFSALVRNEMVQSLSCYFEPEHKQFYSVIQLGTNICGYKRIVHGTNASIIMKHTRAACVM
jgi:hypothetical protein